MAAGQWEPWKILKIGPINIDERFNCVGWRQSDDAQCSNPLHKDDRIAARDLLRELAAKDASSDDFDEPLDELATTLLCRKSGHCDTQKTRKLAEWKFAIKKYAAAESARRGADSIMGEPSDRERIQDLLDEQADIAERLRRVLLDDESSDTGNKSPASSCTTPSSLNISLQINPPFARTCSGQHGKLRTARKAVREDL